MTQIEKFRGTAAAEGGGNDRNREPSKEYVVVPVEVFEVICDLSHNAILELMKLEGFRPEAKWIAKKLDVSVHHVRACIDRLVRTGMLRIMDDDSWMDTSRGLSTHVLGENYTSYAHKKQQLQILKLAIGALQEVPIEERDQSSMMMATSRKRIVEAKARIRRFRRELCEFLEAAPEKDSVYQMSVSVFPITRSAIKEEK